ncbi:MAG: Dcp1p-Dcp2p decapping enzyme complex alpha subunit [Alectoria fallacina]|uniref:mRNA-capping enzyme subunit alpha n=1 Tax=Alectoria fallacina TaxID=1903189 RepID=A0A8H3EEZ1_9LECA|nr:MAG: Dcp1p-Dcp2p decapping enzyme complex alpha subunit [Alectoria fallacina]
MGGSVPDIPGVKAEGPLLTQLRAEVAELLDRKSPNFPGAQPVSFAARHIAELQKQDYFVCEKSDGIRCLMYLTYGDQSDGRQQVIYLIDRKNDYWYVPGPVFPKSVDKPYDFHVATILDGELVNDTQADGSIRMKYLVFDCLVLDANRLIHRTLDKRLGYFYENLDNPLQAFYKKWKDDAAALPFLVERKKMELAYGIEKMFKEILPNLPHGNDGLIFTCKSTPYQFGTDQHILKWKSEAENSIDFRMVLDFPTIQPDSDDDDADEGPYPDYSALPEIELYVNGDGDTDIPYGRMHVEKPEWEGMKSLQQPLNWRIVECSQDKSSQWRFLRFRDDKKEANHISTVNSVMESIQDSVSKEHLIGVAKSIRDHWKKREQPAVVRK